MILQPVVQQSFTFLESLPVVVEVSPTQLSSDGGLLPLREFDQHVGLTSGFAAALEDSRDPGLLSHTVQEMVRSRVYGILAGYEDQNDHDSLRSDPVFKLIAGRSPNGEALASQPTLSRFENDVSIASLKRLRGVFVDQFIASFAEPPRHVTLDFDAVDDAAHGAQQLVMFHGYYEQYQYLPLVVTCAENDQIVLLSLRPGNVHAALGADDDLEYLVNRLRQVWPDVVLHIRGDAGFGMPWMVERSEQLAVDYSYGFATNAVLKRHTEPLLAQAKAAYEEDCRQAKAANLPVPPTRRLFAGFWYQANTWPHARWLIVKAEANAQGDNRRFILCNRPGAQVLPEAAYDDYTQRGESENRNKEFKCDLAMDRMSDHRFVANFFRLYLHALALNLLVRMRRLIAAPPTAGERVVDALAVPQAEETGPSAEPSALEILAQIEAAAAADPTSPTATATPPPTPEQQRRRAFNRRRRHDPLGEGHANTWRLLFIKVAVEVQVSVRRVLVRLSASWPYLHFFQTICERLRQRLVPAPGPTG